MTRMADANGSIYFAGTMYRAGRMWACQPITVTLVAGSVQLSVDGKVVRVHAARHDPAKEHGAFATPTADPTNPKPCKAATGVKLSSGYRYLTRDGRLCPSCGQRCVGRNGDGPQCVDDGPVPVCCGVLLPQRYGRAEIAHSRHELFRRGSGCGGPDVAGVAHVVEAKTLEASVVNRSFQHWGVVGAHRNLEQTWPHCDGRWLPSAPVQDCTSTPAEIPQLR